VVIVQSYAHVGLQYSLPSRFTPLSGETMQWQLSQAHLTALAEAEVVGAGVGDGGG
jgi:hypothetical protein